VWLDRNGNGLLDGSEPGVAGIELTLASETLSENAPNTSRSTISSGNGGFEFGAVAPGRHILALVQIPSLQCTTANRVSVEVGDSPVRVDATFGIKPRGQNRVYLPALSRN
jgi:hypothetical protein